MSINRVINRLFCSILALSCILAFTVNAKTVQTTDNVAVNIVEETERGDCPVTEFETVNYPFVAPRYKQTAGIRNCCLMAPLTLAHVDFNLSNQGTSNPYSSKVGNYRFRIFGCRRQTKEALLNHGRMIQKNIDFKDVFKASFDKCFNLIDIPTDVCLADENVVFPEYVLTAEITDFFMNLCDGFDWDKTKNTNKRTGSAEMTVTWRLMNLTQTEVMWKGVTSGYADLENGVFDGEIALAEAAFADASSQLGSLVGFETTLSQRIDEEKLNQDRQDYIAYDNEMNPGKCYFEEEVKETQSCLYAPMPTCPITPCNCPVVEPCSCPTAQPCGCPVVEPCGCHTEIEVNEEVDVKTYTKTIKEEHITTTITETPKTICENVCKPVCPKKTVKKTTTTVVEEVVEEITEEQAPCPIKCHQTCTPKPQVVEPVVIKKVVVEEVVEPVVEVKKEVVVEVVEPVVEVKKEITIEVVEPVVEVKKEVVVEVVEDSGFAVSNDTVAPQIIENDGYSATHRIYENCINEKGDVIADGSCTIIDDSWVDLEEFNVSSTFCITDRPQFNEFTPENMELIKSSVVKVVSSAGAEGSGLLVADKFVVTSASVVNKINNTYTVTFVDGAKVEGKAVRVNPSKNTALLELNSAVKYNPIALNLDLPTIDQEGLMSISFDTQIDTNGKLFGYRYSDNLGTELVVDTLVEEVSLGGALFDNLGTLQGISNSAKQTKQQMDLFLPAETVIRSLGITVCEKVYENKSPWQKTVYKPISEKIEAVTVAPEVMQEVDRK